MQENEIVNIDLSTTESIMEKRLEAHNLSTDKSFSAKKNENRL